MENEFIIDTSINAKGVEVGANEINKKMTNLGQTVQKTADKMSNSMNKALGSGVPTEAYAKLEAEFGRLEQKIQKVGQAQDKYLATGGKEGTSVWKKYEYDIEMYGAQQDKVLAKMRQMENEGSAFQGVVPPGQKEALAEMGNAAARAAGQTKKLDNAQKSTNKTAKKGISIFGGLRKAFSKHNGGIKVGFKNVLKYAFGIRSLFVLVNKLRSALVAGFNNMAKFNNGVNPVNDALSSLKSALTRLKNSFATAFAPILTTIAPILTTFINYLSDAITMLGMFFARLTGAKSFTKAKKVQEKYAEATEDAADAQEKLNNQLGQYDKLMVIDQNTASKKSSSNSGTDPNDMFEVVDLDDSAVNWADKFKEAWEKADFTEIGYTIGTKIKEALENIPWDDIEKQSKKVAMSIGTFINGFVESGAFQEMGTSVAKGINVSLRSTDTFLTTVDWEKLGKSITESISNFFATFSFSDLGKTIVDFLASAINLASGLLKGIDFRELPKNIANAIKDVLTGANWGNLFEALGNLAGSLLKAIFDWQVGLAELMQDIGLMIRDYFVKEIQKAGWDNDNSLADNGKALIVGLFNGIINFMKGIGKWIVKNISEPFCLGVAKAFGIVGDKATVDDLRTLGEDIIEGVFGGVIDWMKGIKDWLKTNVFDKFVNAWDSVSTASEFVIEIKPKFSDTKEKLKEKWESLTGGIKDKTADIKASISQKWSDLKTKWESITNNIKDQNPKVKFALQKWSDLKASLKSIVNKMIDWLNTNFIGKLNKLFKVTIPKNAITKFLGISGITKQIVSIPKIPKLATGAVIPPNHEFLAMLGDQKRGVNIETPLDTMIQAFETALDARGNSSMPEKIDVYLPNSKVLAEAVWDEEEKRYKQAGSFRPSYA